MNYIKRGILVKSELPRKEDCNFSSLPSIELLKNQLKAYLEILSNQPPTKINAETAFAQRTEVNFLPQELLEFLNFDEKFIGEIMDF